MATRMVHCSLYLFEGTGSFALIAAGQVPSRTYRQRSSPRPSRTQQKCSGTCPGWRCPICWIKSYIVALKGFLSHKACRKILNIVKTMSSVGVASNTTKEQFVVF